MNFRGEFQLTLFRQGEECAYIYPNTNSIEGVRTFLNYIFLKTDTTARTWFLGFISPGSYTTVTVSDTGAVHPGWVEHTGYWVNGVHGHRAPITLPAGLPAPQPNTAALPGLRDFGITNATTKPIQFNSPGTIVRGVFISSSRSHNTGGVLIGTAIFSAGGEPLINHGDEFFGQYRWRWDTVTTTE